MKPKNESCGQCLYWNHADVSKFGEAQCLRYPPTPWCEESRDQSGNPTHYWMYNRPYMNYTEWCGEFKCQV